MVNSSRTVYFSYLGSIIHDLARAQKMESLVLNRDGLRNSDDILYDNKIPMNLKENSRGCL